MAYTIPADAHSASVTWWWKGIELETTDISDANLTALIAEMSNRFDEETNDHYEPEAGVTLTLDGRGGRILELPRRLRVLTSVQTAIYGTNFVTEAVGNFVYDAFTGSARQIKRMEKIEIDLPISTGWAFPNGHQNVKVTGDFSWAVCPDRVKRAVALMCWEVVRPLGDYVRYAEGMTVDGSTIPPIMPGGISRIPEVLQIAQEFQRETVLVA